MKWSPSFDKLCLFSILFVAFFVIDWMPDVNVDARMVTRITKKANFEEIGYLAVTLLGVAMCLVASIGLVLVAGWIYAFVSPLFTKK